MLLFTFLVGAGLVLLLLQRKLRASKRLTDSLNQRFQDLADNVPGVLFQFRLRPDGTSHFPLVSTRIQAIYRCSQSQVQDDASSVFQVIHPDDLDVVRRSIQDSARQMSVWHATYRVLHPQRGEIWVEGSSTPTLQDDGSVLWHGVIIDITELQHNRQALRLAGQVVQFTSDAVVIFDKDGSVQQVNPAFIRMTGYDFATIAQNGLNCLDPVSFPANEAAVRVDRRDTVWMTATGEPLPVLLSISPVRGESDDITHFVLVAKDISEMRSKQDELDRLAHYDALTGLPNRRLLADRLDQAVAHARRTGESLALAMLDLDDFKPVNDRYGHDAGDRLLVEVSNRLKATVRAEDTVARLGGDEFTLILWNVQGDTPFERVIACVREPVVLDQGVVQVSASMGVTFFDPVQPMNGEQLMRQADVALYRSKEQGRNRYTLFEE
ncbi:diguanylate cyclase domain-containing protein [Orrella marina]